MIESIELRIKAIIEDSGLSKLISDLRKTESEIKRLSQAARKMNAEARFLSSKGRVSAEQAKALRDQSFEIKQQVANLQDRKKVQMQEIAAVRESNKERINSIKRQNAALQKATNEARRFKMEWLSVLFFGQAIMRVFGGILRASFQTWSAVTEGTSQAGGAMTQLQAAWEFFKYSLFDALLNSGLFQGFVDVVLRLVEWWGNLSDSSKAFLANMILIGAAIGTALAGAGIVKLGFDGVERLITEAGGIATTLQTTIGAIAIGYSLVQAVDAFKDFEEGKWLDGMLGAIGASLTAVGGIRLLKNKKGGGALIALGVAFEMIESGTFLTSIGNILSVISSMFLTLFDSIGHQFKFGLMAAIASALSDWIDNVADMLRDIPGMGGLVKMLDAASVGIRGTVGSVPDFDYVNTFARYFVDSQQNFERWNSQLESAINSAQANSVARAQGIASFPDQLDVRITNWEDNANASYGYTPVPDDSVSRSGLSYYS